MTNPSPVHYDPSIQYKAHCPRCMKEVVSHKPLNSMFTMGMRCGCGCAFTIRLKDFKKIKVRA